MTLWRRLTENNAPRWMVIAAAAVCLLSLSGLGWMVVTAREGEAGPPKRVYPGMYDLRAEVAKMRTVRKHDEAPHGR